VKYRRPGVSWVTVLVLGFAAVGAAAVGGTIFKKVTGLILTPQRARPVMVVYRPLAMDDAVLINVAVSPRDARLMLDGEPLPSNPVRLPRGPKPHMLAAAATGFTPAVEEFTADKHKTVRLHLARAEH
jgi:hypothetical protein